MTPTTKAALDAAENLLRRFRNYIVELSEPRVDLAAVALRLIAEARKAEESDTARLDWLEAQGTIRIDLHMNGNYEFNDESIPGDHKDSIRAAIDSAMASVPEGEKSNGYYENESEMANQMGTAIMQAFEKMRAERDTARQEAEQNAALVALIAESAQAVITRWDGPHWKQIDPTAKVIYALRDSIQITPTAALERVQREAAAKEALHLINYWDVCPDVSREHMLELLKARAAELREDK